MNAKSSGEIYSTPCGQSSPASPRGQLGISGCQNRPYFGSYQFWAAVPVPCHNLAPLSTWSPDWKRVISIIVNVICDCGLGPVHPFIVVQFRDVSY
jgi:hypothetical protein